MTQFSNLKTVESFDDAIEYRVYTERDFDKIEQLQALPDDLRFEMRAVANVLPFRVN
ncbi:MAG: lysine 2,3-aminomutase, partial [Gammaproteobacteria bacterium]|nr:lysine 2,3-aminomutase [Gammaproteobacteria bacterium]